LGLTDKIAIVTVLKNVLPLIASEIAKAHLTNRVPIVKSVDIPVIEAAQTAVMMLEMYAKMNLKQSRVTYMPIPKK